jgi:hypothetical protein
MQNQSKRSTFFGSAVSALLAAGLLQTASAITAYPGPLTEQQPDGKCAMSADRTVLPRNCLLNGVLFLFIRIPCANETKHLPLPSFCTGSVITLFARGTENFHWRTDTDGYPVVRDPSNPDLFVYATYDNSTISMSGGAPCMQQSCLCPCTRQLLCRLVVHRTPANGSALTLCAIDLSLQRAWFRRGPRSAKSTRGRSACPPTLHPTVWREWPPRISFRATTSSRTTRLTAWRVSSTPPPLPHPFLRYRP